MYNKPPEIKLTEDLELRKNPNYQKVMEIVKQLWNTDIVSRATGYCFSISDMMRTLLLHQGIDCEIVECQLMMQRSNPPLLITLGYDEPLKPGSKEINTHVVVVTKTEIPMIIDLSIGHIQPDVVGFIVERANGLNGTIGTVTVGPTTWIYTAKQHQKFPHFYQQSIVDRISTDQRVKKEISWLKILIIVAICISTVNAVRGAYDFYQVYINTENFWGPDHLRGLTEKVDRLEELVKKPIDQRE